MTRGLLSALFCVSLAACNGSGENAPASSGDTGDDPASFNPAAMTVDTPPVGGSLPAELLPPA